MTRAWYAILRFKIELEDIVDHVCLRNFFRDHYYGRWNLLIKHKPELYEEEHPSQSQKYYGQ